MAGFPVMQHRRTRKNSLPREFEKHMPPPAVFMLHWSNTFEPNILPFQPNILKNVSTIRNCNDMQWCLPEFTGKSSATWFVVPYLTTAQRHPLRFALNYNYWSPTASHHQQPLIIYYQFASGCGSRTDPCTPGCSHHSNDPALVELLVCSCLFTKPVFGWLVMTHPHTGASPHTYHLVRILLLAC